MIQWIEPRTLRMTRAGVSRSEPETDHTRSSAAVFFVPTAIGYHGRTAGQSAGGYLHLFKFIHHHNKLSRQIRRWNYKNHILMYLKNTPHVSLSFLLRELVMLGYILIFEPATLGVVPELLRQMKTLKDKRKIN